MMCLLDASKALQELVAHGFLIPKELHSITQPENIDEWDNQ